MASNVNTRGDPRSFMYYNGQYYINGTIVELSDQYVQNNSFQGKKIWKYARFDRQANSSGSMSYFFSAAKFDYLSLREMGLSVDVKKEYAHYFTIDACMAENAIQRVIRPVKLTKIEQEAMNSAFEDMITHPKKDWDYAELRFGWLAYIVILVASLIFKQFYIIWIVATFLFFAWRKDILKQ
jgi:hypothetical protein